MQMRQCLILILAYYQMIMIYFLVNDTFYPFIVRKENKAPLLCYVFMALQRHPWLKPETPSNKRCIKVLENLNAKQ